MEMLRAANLALKFALELVSLAAFAYWGATVADGVAGVVLVIAAPLAAAVLWGAFAAPRAAKRLPLRLRAPFELGVFGLAALALLRASTAAAVALAVVAVANAILLSRLGQWDA
jgi:Protein of unknown function (DUF2568)